MAISKLILNGVTQMDATQTTVDPEDMLAGTTALDRSGTTITGTLMMPTLFTVTLSANSWSNKSQTVSVSSVLADETKQLVGVMPSTASKQEYTDSCVGVASQSAGTITFNCKTTPTNNLTVYVIITDVINGDT